MVSGGWQVVIGCWSMDGQWWLTGGYWFLVDGQWWLTGGYWLLVRWLLVVGRWSWLTGC